MGVCSSSEEKKVSVDVSLRLAREGALSNRVLKLLLLGPGSSGKSTILKQIVKIYGSGFNEMARNHYKQMIHHNMFEAMLMLVDHSAEFGSLSSYGNSAKLIIKQAQQSIKDSANGEHTSSSSSSSSSTRASITNFAITDDFLANELRVLWTDPVIQTTFENAASFHLPESVKYFFDKLSYISNPSYMPSDDDILHCRSATIGINETNVIMKQRPVKIIDVGGQRSERRKWLHCFEGVHALIFVAAISEYNQMLAEDNSQNRLTEAFQVFESVVNLPWFSKSAIILFLNKRDLFAAKIEKVPFSDYFPEYTGPNRYQNVIEWIGDHFIRFNKDAEREIFIHVTWATDTKSTEAVVSDVTATIIRKRIANAGLS